MGDILISKQALLDELEKLDWQELYLPTHFKDIIDDMPTFSQKPEHGWNGYIGREGSEDINKLWEKLQTKMDTGLI